MKKISAWIVAAAGIALAVFVVVSAKETKIQMKDAPAAVQAAVQKETQGATIKDIIRETEGGKTVYEVETTVNGRTRDLLFDSNGAILSVEEEMAFDAVPGAVMKTFASHGKVLTVESVREGSAVAYEARIQTKEGKKITVEVDADGKPVKK